jgi:hypothetical protein
VGSVLLPCSVAQHLHVFKVAAGNKTSEWCRIVAVTKLMWCY